MRRPSNFFRHFRDIALALALATLAGTSAAQADARCARFGSASYTATRMIEGRTTEVVVSGRSSRIVEAGPGGAQLITLVTPTLNVLFATNADPKVAVRLQRRPPPNIPREAVRQRQERSAGQVALITEIVDDDGTWREIERATCRTDGVLLGTRSLASVGGRPVFVEMQHTNIRVGPQPAALFRLPEGFRVVDPPPRPPAR